MIPVGTNTLYIEYSSFLSRSRQCRGPRPKVIPRLLTAAACGVILALGTECRLYLYYHEDCEHQRETETTQKSHRDVPGLCCCQLR